MYEESPRHESASSEQHAGRETTAACGERSYCGTDSETGADGGEVSTIESSGLRVTTTATVMCKGSTLGGLSLSGSGDAIEQDKQ